jgi:hypothetical protein
MGSTRWQALSAASTRELLTPSASTLTLGSPWVPGPLLLLFGSGYFDTLWARMQPENASARETGAWEVVIFELSCAT